MRAEGAGGGCWGELQQSRPRSAPVKTDQEDEFAVLGKVVHHPIGIAVEGGGAVAVGKGDVGGR